MADNKDVKLQSAPIKLHQPEESPQDFEVTGQDLEILESRIEEIERYLGI